MLLYEIIVTVSKIFTVNGFGQVDNNDTIEHLANAADDWDILRLLKREDA